MRSFALLLCLSFLIACASERGSGSGAQLIPADQGGSVSLNANEVTIPPNSLMEDTSVSLSLAPSSSFPGLDNAPPNVLVLEPRGTVLSTPATVFLTASDPSTVSVRQFVEGDGEAFWRTLEHVNQPGGVQVSVQRFAPLALVPVPIDVPVANEIRGRVTWADGSAVANVPVELWTAGADGPLTTTTADSDGAFSFADLSSGDYRVRVNVECDTSVDATVSGSTPTEVTLVLCGPSS